MQIREPGWWYQGRSPSLAARLLTPMATIYGAVVERRLRRTVPYHSRLPVICVGNLVAGGTGKTPLCLHLAGLLQAQGHAPAMLTRGYGGTISGPHRVDLTQDTSAAVGDEPLLLARAAPTFVARDRAAGAKAIEQTAATHIIMDDGLQNPGLAKSLSLAVIDGVRGIGNGCVIPAGPLRAPLALQVGLIDAIVINDSETARSVVPAPIAAIFNGPILRARRRLAQPLDWLAERAWVAFAGIGRPDGFFAMLEQAGAQLAARISFSDHHAYTTSDAQLLLDLAAQHGADLITTEKDLARLSADSGPLRQLADAARAPGLDVSLAPEDTAMLQRLLAMPPRGVARLG